MSDNCPKCNNEGIMVEVRGVYDGGLYFICPAFHVDTGGPWAWHRWDVGDRLHDVAEPYIREYRVRGDRVQGKASQA